MDFYKAVQTLHEELRKINQAIATVEELLTGMPGKPAKRRGRTHMSAEERRAVSERMKKYWAARRNGQEGSTEPAD